MLHKEPGVEKCRIERMRRREVQRKTGLAAVRAFCRQTAFQLGGCRREEYRWRLTIPAVLLTGETSIPTLSRVECTAHRTRNNPLSSKTDMQSLPILLLARDIDSISQVAASLDTSTSTQEAIRRFMGAVQDYFHPEETNPTSGNATSSSSSSLVPPTTIHPLPRNS